MSGKQRRVATPQFGVRYPKIRSTARTAKLKLVIAPSRDEPFFEPMSELAPVGPSPDF